MIRLSKMADYGIVLLSYVAQEEGTCTARQLSDWSGLPLPTVSKVLKALARHGLLSAHRGKQGGYALARAADNITVADMVAAVDGPIALTECAPHSPAMCDLEPTCPNRENWLLISNRVRVALEELTLTDMTLPGPPQHKPKQRLVHLKRQPEA